MKRNNKGFTIVELVIVIAVIAILASVLVPTFSGVVTKAQRSADTQVVRMLNGDIAIDLVQKSKNKHNTMYDAIQACLEMGVSPDKISAKSDYNIAWESSSGRFVLIDPANKKVMYPQSDETYDIYDISGKEIDYFIVTTYDNRIEEDENFKYSIYAYGNDWPKELTIHAGFDAGDVNGIEKITYENKGNKQSVIIRTNCFETKLVVDGNIEDDVKHYGMSGLVEVVQVGKNSFEEYGVVGRLNVEYGHINLKESSVVYQLNVENNANVLVSKDYNSILYDANGKVLDESLSKSEERFADVSEKIEGSACTHDNGTKIVIDNNGVYEVCKKCGYTLICIDDNKTKKTVFDNDNENVIIKASTYDDDKIKSTNNGMVELKENVVATEILAVESTSTLDICDHNFNECTVLKAATNDETGLERYSCNLCNSSYTVVTPNLHSHSYGTLIDGVAATCTKKGTIEHYHCDGCGKDFDKNYVEVTSLEIPLANHTYSTKTGFTTRCLICYSDTTNYTVSQNTITIKTANGLEWFSEVAKSGNNFAGKTVELDADLDLTSNSSFLPIVCTDTSYCAFKGTFDGKSHTISNATIDSRETGSGLFAALDSATVKNLTLTKFTVQYSTGSYTKGVALGVVAGYAINDVTLSSVTVSSSTIYGNYQCGGLIGATIGEDKTLTLDTCNVSSVQLKVTYNCGNLVGLNAYKHTISSNSVSCSSNTKKQNPNEIYKYLETTISCSDSPDGCLEKGTKVTGAYYYDGSNYWAFYSAKYIQEGSSTHNCSLTGETGLLMHSQKIVSSR